MENRANRLSLTLAQRRVIDSDDVGWLGWDAHDLPVLADKRGRYAVGKRGEQVEVTEPVGD